MKVIESFDWRLGSHIIRALIRDDDTILWESLEEGTTGLAAQKVQSFDTFRTVGVPRWVPHEAHQRLMRYLDEERPELRVGESPRS